MNKNGHSLTVSARKKASNISAGFGERYFINKNTYFISVHDSL